MLHSTISTSSSKLAYLALAAAVGVASLNLKLSAGVGVAALGVTAGQGRWQFELVPDYLELPTGTHLLNAHGWEVDSAGNLYLTYEPIHAQTIGTLTKKAGADLDANCLVRWDARERQRLFRAATVEDEFSMASSSSSSSDEETGDVVY